MTVFRHALRQRSPLPEVAVMAVFPQLERFVWFDSQLKDRRFPNASHLAQQFEVSHKTAQRDITRLRDRLRAPIEYDPVHKGYYYTDDSLLHGLVGPGRLLPPARGLAQVLSFPD
jgi:hypothetical protein